MSRVSSYQGYGWTKAVKQCYGDYGQGGNDKTNLACDNLSCPASTRPRLVAEALRQRSLRTLYFLFQLCVCLTRRPRLKHVNRTSRVGAVKVNHVNRLIRSQTEEGATKALEAYVKAKACQDDTAN